MTKQDNRRYVKPIAPWKSILMLFVDIIQSDGAGSGFGGYTGYACIYSRKVNVMYDKYKCHCFKWKKDGTVTKNEKERRIDKYSPVFRESGYVIFPTAEAIRFYIRQCVKKTPSPTTGPND